MKEHIIEIMKQEAELMTQKSEEALRKYYNLDYKKLMEESDRIASEYRENVADKILDHLTAEQGDDYVVGRSELLISFSEYLHKRDLLNVVKENIPIRVKLFLKRN